MINLLPRPLQDKLKEEENLKAVAILGIVCVAAALVFVLLLALVWVFYSAESRYGQVVIAEKEQEMKIFDIAASEKDIASGNSMVLMLESFYKKQVRVTDIYRRVAAALPPGASLTGFDYAAGKVYLSGFVPDRGSLVVFKNNLEKQPDFKETAFPPDNWLTAQNINFSVSFKHEPQ